MRNLDISAARFAPTFAAAVLGVLLIAPTLAAQQSPSAASASPYTIAVNVNEVLLHVTVRTHGGTPVAGLQKSNFQIFEDGVPQSITHFSHQDIPVTTGLVIDNSGSMRPKRAEVIESALAFAASSNPHDEMFLVNFNERVSFGLPRNIPFTDKPERLKAAMGTVISDGETALYDALVVALDHVKAGSRDKKVLIVVSDGADNASSHKKKEVLEMAARSDAIIYALAIYEPDDPDRNPRVLRELARASGGEAFAPESLREVLPICEHIARAIRDQYTLSYIPSNQKRDGAYRAIHVRATSARGSSLNVLTRTGYVAPANAAAPNSSSATR